MNLFAQRSMDDGLSPRLDPLIPLLAGLRPIRLVVVGDVMLDRYVEGVTRRSRAEDGVDVLLAGIARDCAGGAANVALNASGMGAGVQLLGIVGMDASGAALETLLAEAGVATDGLVRLEGRPTTVKQRFSAGKRPLLRVDTEVAAPLPAEAEQRLAAAARAAVATAEAVILSDYGKGVLLGKLSAEVIAAARARDLPVFVDPKGTDFGRYRGADYLTPNEVELAQVAAGGDGADMAQQLVAALGLEGLVVTQGARGATLVMASGETVFPVRPVEAADPIGAGDSFIAMLALAVGSGLPIAEAVTLANLAAASACACAGTAVVTLDALRAEAGASALGGASVDAACDQIEAWRKAGLRIGFTNGCFDVLHAGHVHLLQQARARCDRLVVAVNSDASVQALKGPGRPVHALAHRMQLLRALDAVDLVLSFDELTPLRLIEAITPDLLVKGADYTVETVVGARHVLAHGGEVLLAELVDGLSTTSALARLDAARR